MDQKDILNKISSLEKAQRDFQEAYTQDLENVTRLLNVIHKRLVGDIEKDTSGLINEVKEQNDRNKANADANILTHKRLEEISAQIASFRADLEDCKKKALELDIVKKEVSALKNTKLIGYGAAIVVGYIFTHFSYFLSFLKKFGN